MGVPNSWMVYFMEKIQSKMDDDYFGKLPDVLFLWKPKENQGKPHNPPSPKLKETERNRRRKQRIPKERWKNLRRTGFRFLCVSCCFFWFPLIMKSHILVQPIRWKGWHCFFWPIPWWKCGTPVTENTLVLIGKEKEENTRKPEVLKERWPCC